MRFSSRSMVIVASLLLTVGVGRGAYREMVGSAAADDAAHPVVGTWLVATNVDNPADPAAWALFGTDGTFIRNSPTDGVGLGAWQATGPRTATLTIVVAKPGTDDQVETQVTRATIEVAPDGDRLTSTYTLEVVGADGTGRGQYGPGLAEGKRVVPEPMGKPVGPLAEDVSP